MSVSENVVYPIVPNGFADQTIPMKNGYFIGKINPTFSDKAICSHVILDDLNCDIGPMSPKFVEGSVLSIS